MINIASKKRYSSSSKLNLGLVDTIQTATTVGIPSFETTSVAVAALAETVANVPMFVSNHPYSFSSSLLAEESSYSSLSLYFTLALYVLTLPGLYSLVSRSVKVKLVEKQYELPGPSIPNARAEKMVAAEVMAYFKARNYEITAAQDTITFRGVMGRSNSQAYFLTFCTFVGLGSLALVLSILLPDLGSKAYFITLISPYAGFYYWNNAQREDVIKLKMETADDESSISITAQGGKDDLEEFSKALELPERGKVYVKGIFESNDKKVKSSSEPGSVENLESKAEDKDPSVDNDSNSEISE